MRSSGYFQCYDFTSLQGHDSPDSIFSQGYYIFDIDICKWPLLSKEFQRLVKASRGWAYSLHDDSLPLRATGGAAEMHAYSNLTPSAFALAEMRRFMVQLMLA